MMAKWNNILAVKGAAWNVPTDTVTELNTLTLVAQGAYNEANSKRDNPIIILIESRPRQSARPGEGRFARSASAPAALAKARAHWRQIRLLTWATPCHITSVTRFNTAHLLGGVVAFIKPDHLT